MLYSVQIQGSSITCWVWRESPRCSTKFWGRNPFQFTFLLFFFFFADFIHFVKTTIKPAYQTTTSVDRSWHNKRQVGEEESNQKRKVDLSFTLTMHSLPALHRLIIIVLYIAVWYLRQLRWIFPHLSSQNLFMLGVFPKFTIILLLDDEAICYYCYSPQ